MKNIPLILAIDTSTGPCTVALARGKKILAYERMDDYQQQSKRLMGMIDSVYRQAGVSVEATDAFACTLGPGNFTSLRIGLAAARGLALARGKKMIGVSSLEILARGAAENNGDGFAILSLINAHRGEVYGQVFMKDGEEAGEAFVLSVEGLAEKMEGRSLLVAGNARALVEPLLKNARYDEGAAHPDAKWLAGAALHILANGETTSSNPIYIRSPDAKLPALRANP